MSKTKTQSKQEKKEKKVCSPKTYLVRNRGRGVSFLFASRLLGRGILAIGRGPVSSAARSGAFLTRFDVLDPVAHDPRHACACPAGLCVFAIGALLRDFCSILCVLGISARQNTTTNHSLLPILIFFSGTLGLVYFECEDRTGAGKWTGKLDLSRFSSCALPPSRAFHIWKFPRGHFFFTCGNFLVARSGEKKTLRFLSQLKPPDHR